LKEGGSQSEVIWWKREIRMREHDRRRLKERESERIWRTMVGRISEYERRWMAQRERTGWK
jgi:hypothetical protein